MRIVKDFGDLCINHIKMAVHLASRPFVTGPTIWVPYIHTCMSKSGQPYPGWYRSTKKVTLNIEIKNSAPKNLFPIAYILI